jgi:hypothetical protein
MPETSSRDIQPSDDYVSKLLKLLPAEITAAYLSVRSICTPENSNNDLFIGIFAVLIFLAAPLYMWRVLKMKNNLQVLFLTFSFLVWVANIEIARIDGYSQAIAGAVAHAPAAAAWVVELLTAPTFIKGIAVVWVVLLSPLLFAHPAPVEPPTGPESAGPESAEPESGEPADQPVQI